MTQPHVTDTTLAAAPRPGWSNTIGGRQGLPDDLLASAARRLRSACIVILVVFATLTVGMFMAPPAGATGLGIAAAAGVLTEAMALLMLWLAFRNIEPQRLLDIGLVFEVVCALGIATAETFSVYHPEAQVRGVSWVCILVLGFPVLVPSTPGKALLAGLAAASMGPLALLAAMASGIAAPTPIIFAQLTVPNYLAAGFSLVLSRVIHRLGTDVSRARQMGSYHLVQRLGSGGMGEVWRARHGLLARPAAIKLVNPSALSNASPEGRHRLVERFKREAQATSSLRSPHTIQLYDFGMTADGQFYYVMELLTGADLETIVERNGPLPAARVRHFLGHVAESLCEAHAAGLVHRDIKPANLFACRLGMIEDHVKVLDFGLVVDRSEIAGASDGLTANNQITGTPAYLAPESVTGEGEQGAPMDIYALGCVAYRLLTGRLTFEADTVVQMAFAHVDRQPVPPSEVTDNPIPRRFEALVLDCLKKQPGDRPTAPELIERLRDCDTGDWSQADAREWWVEHPVEKLEEPSGPGQLLETVLTRQ